MDISVIVPIYKGKKYIDKIIQMLEKNIRCLTQTFETKKEVELILVNDYPYEDIYQSDIPKSEISIVLLRNDKNLGIHQSRVNGLNLSKGKYILFLDQDDTIEENYLESQLKCIKNADAVLCNGIFRGHKKIYSTEDIQKAVITKAGYLSQKNVIISPGQVLLKKDIIPMDWKKSVLRENGSDDVLLWIMLLNININWKINHASLYYHTEEGENTSLNFKGMKKSVQELACVVKKRNLLQNEDETLFLKALDERIIKYEKYIGVLEHWDLVLSNLSFQIKTNRYKKIAIYGYGVIGKKLLADLCSIGVKIDIIIDKDAENYLGEQQRFVSLIELNQKVDLTIVTPLFDKEKIFFELQKNEFIKTIIALDEL